MSQSAALSPVMLFVAYLDRLILAVEGLRACYKPRVALETIRLVDLRFQAIKRRFRDLAGRIAAGTWRPRPASDTPRKPPETVRPKPEPGPERKASLFRRRGWLSPLFPETVAQYRGSLLRQLQNPEMAALIEAAPAEMKRVLRPLCWGLGIKPPPILALPRRPRPPKPAKPKRKRRRPAKPLGTMPDWMRVRIPSAQWPPGVEDPLPQKLRSKKFG